MDRGGKRARSAFGCREDRVRFLFGEDERVSGGKSGAGRRLAPLSVRASSLYDGIQQTVKREGRKEGRKEGKKEGTRRRDDCLANVEKSLLPDFNRGNLFPFSRFASPSSSSLHPLLPVFPSLAVGEMAEDWFYYNTRVCSMARSSFLQRFVCLSTRDIKGSLR